MRTGVRAGVLTRACLLVSCIPPSNTTSSEYVGVGAIVTRDSFLSIDFGVATGVFVAFGASAFSKSAGSPV